LGIVRNNTNLTPISFDDAVKKAYLLDGKLNDIYTVLVRIVMYYLMIKKGSGSFDTRYRMKNRVKVIHQDPLEVCWIYNQIPKITIDKIKISRV
jgi:hypothetical protein